MRTTITREKCCQNYDKVTHCGACYCYRQESGYEMRRFTGLGCALKIWGSQNPGFMDGHYLASLTRFPTLVDPKGYVIDCPLS